MDGRNKKPLLRTAVALGLACFLSTTAFAVDDDLPAPTDGFEEDLPNGGNPPPQNDLPDYVARAKRCGDLSGKVTLQEYQNFRTFVKSIHAVEIGMSIYHDIEGREIDRDGFARIAKVRLSCRDTFLVFFLRGRFGVINRMFVGMVTGCNRRCAVQRANRSYLSAF